MNLLTMLISRNNGPTFFNTLLLVLLLASCQEKGRFKLLGPEQTSIVFNNEIIENDSFNILVYEYVYNGGGVAVADFNNDGREDVFFTGNMVPNKLYLNEGDWKFTDITARAGVGAEDRWCSGVAVIDINEDGFDDLYVCATAYSSPDLRQNLLFVNQGPDEKGVPRFREEAGAYGINDISHTTTAVFLDYDLDGDMDLFLAINKMDDSKNPNIYRDRIEPSPDRVDRLFRNDRDEKSGQRYFTNVSEEAGIIYDGYSLGVNVSDINQDGWSDIYVTNDYLSQDLVYINNQDGTFTNQADTYFQHTSFSAMGNDIVDLNNDAYPDVLALDMLPEDNFRRKTMLMNNNYTHYVNNERFNFQYQFVRNTLQMNRGVNPQTGQPLFSDVALMAGISSTDWSWAPLVADFDNDGLRDIIITNGFPKDVTDRDFVDYNSNYGRYKGIKELLPKIPSVKIKNYAYRNTGDGRFENVTEKWGVKYPSFSNGAAYGDLDNDGDLDYVVNNINDPAFVYENRSEQMKDRGNWIRIKLKGETSNLKGFGAKVIIYYGNKISYWDHNTSHGYLSSVEDVIHFGLGKGVEMIDSMVVKWPSTITQRLYNLPVNQMVRVVEKGGRMEKDTIEEGPLRVFEKVKEGIFTTYKHEELDVVDFNIQPLLPHKLSQYGPGIAVSDVNGDGIDDVYISGPRLKKGTFFVSREDGSYEPMDLVPGDEESKNQEELGCLFFDADSDGDQDLYLVSGSNEAPDSSGYYQDRFFENVDGAFVLRTDALPSLTVSGSCVRAADYDRDGDLDLFVGGRLVPFKYPQPASSYVLKNESKSGQLSFRIDTQSEGLFRNYGMVTDALWTDFDGDNWVDLVLTGEWMPLRFIKNNAGRLQDISESSGINDKAGWWNSLAAGDFDQDGDIDYLAGNLGINTLFKATDACPITVYGGDFDNNQGFDAIPSLYLTDARGLLNEFPFFGRGDMIKQLNKLRARYKTYAEFGNATMNEILTDPKIENALVYKANYMETSYVENLGNGKFKINPLPYECQAAPVYGMLAEDFDQDGKLDALLVGNDYGCEVLQGRLDAFKGQFLKGNGDGTFSLVSANNSGFFVGGDAKGLACVVNKSGERMVVATQNRSGLEVFRIKAENTTVVPLQPDDFKVSITLMDGSVQTREVYYGHSFLSQSSRSIVVPDEVQKVTITDFAGNERTL